MLAFVQNVRRPIVVAALLGVVWIAAIAGGLRVMARYETTSGTAAAVPQDWPSASAIQPAADRPTVVMLAHPRCPCTRASVAELAEVMARAQEKVAAYVLFLKPANTADDWDDTALRASAQAIPGVTVVTDEDGTEARRFGAETSGHTLLFAADGRLLFSGGITQSRGHAGENIGEQSLLSLIRNEAPAQSRTAVFGCALVKRIAAEGRPLCWK